MAANRDFPYRRELNIALRSLHLAGVVLVGAAIIGNGFRSVPGIVLLLLTGFGLFAIDLWHRPSLWRETAGVFIGVKLALLLAMLLIPGVAAPVFWFLLISSSVVSHAPWEFRHRRILP